VVARVTELQVAWQQRLAGGLQTAAR
jgi:hypothetical protein